MAWVNARTRLGQLRVGGAAPVPRAHTRRLMQIGRTGRWAIVWVAITASFSRTRALPGVSSIARFRWRRHGPGQANIRTASLPAAGNQPGPLTDAGQRSVRPAEQPGAEDGGVQGEPVGRVGRVVARERMDAPEPVGDGPYGEV